MAKVFRMVEYRRDTADARWTQPNRYAFHGAGPVVLDPGATANGGASGGDTADAKAVQTGVSGLDLALLAAAAGLLWWASKRKAK